MNLWYLFNEFMNMYISTYKVNLWVIFFLIKNEIAIDFADNLMRHYGLKHWKRNKNSLNEVWKFLTNMTTLKSF